MLNIHSPGHALTEPHPVLDRSLLPPWPEGLVATAFGMGCFWGAEKAFWQQPGVFVTAVGYAGGGMNNPDYRSVCSGQTGHAEVVLVVHEADALPALLKVFWESHNPTQGMRQGNDIGSQYRSAIYLADAQSLPLAHTSRDNFQAALNDAGFGEITTEIAVGTDFWFAEDYHQQYLVKNPAGYCGLGGTGIKSG